jgi:hypothetical protein
MIKWIRKIFKGQAQRDPNLKFWDTVDGTDIYYYESINDMPRFRAAIINVVIEKIGFGVRPTDSLAYTSLIDEELKICIKEQDPNKLEQRLYRIKSLNDFYHKRIEAFLSPKLMMELAGHAVILEGEPVEYMSVDYYNKKQALLANNAIVYDFFLTVFTKFVVELRKGLEESDLEIYLTLQNLAEEKIFFELMSEPYYETLWNEKIRKHCGFLND